jgi:hypothetical protein
MNHNTGAVAMNVQHRTSNIELPTPFLPLCGSAALREDPPAKAQGRGEVWTPWARRLAEAAIGAGLVALPFVTLWAVETTARWMEGRP